MPKNSATPLVLNNGVYLQSTSHDSHSHLDYAHLMHMNGGKQHMTDLGVIQPFVTSGYLMKPYLYNFGNINANRVYVDGNLYKWSTPLADEPCYIVEDITTCDKPGQAGEKFKIKVNSRKYDHGYILAVDQHSPEQLLVTEDEIYNEGDSVILTVKYAGVDPANRWFPREYLRPGTKLFAISTTESERSTTYSSIPTMSGGMREYFNYVGCHRGQLHYSITRDAAYTKVSNKIIASLDKHKEIIEMYVFRKDTLGYDLSLQGQGKNHLSAMYTRKYGKKKGAGQMKADIAYRAWVPRIEAMGLAYLEAMVENEAIFGAGGPVHYDGPQATQRSLGLFHQLNMGNQHTYNLYNFTLEKFEFILASRLHGRIEPFQNNEIVIKTGRGGLAWIQNMLRRLPSQHGMVLQGNDYITGIGSNQNQKLGWTNPNFVSWTMGNGLGTVRFELVPGLDPEEANEQINPLVPASKGIGGHRLSSYMFIIDDITNTGDNVVELVCKDDWDTQMSVHQGKLAYPGTKFGNGMWQRGSNHPGFEVYMEKRHKAYWVKDVTKSLLIKPINPFTGRALYSGYYK